MNNHLPLAVKAFQPRYRLGSIKNKYLIIEIYAFAYLTREEAIYWLFKHDKSSRKLVIQLYKQLPSLIPQTVQVVKLKNELLITSSFLITSTNHSNNHLRLDLVVEAGTTAFSSAVDLLASRHLKNTTSSNLSFIKDKLTISFQKKYFKNEEL